MYEPPIEFVPFLVPSLPETDSTPWVIVGVFGALLVIALIVIIVLVLRGRKQ